MSIFLKFFSKNIVICKKICNFANDSLSRADVCDLDMF